MDSANFMCETVRQDWTCDSLAESSSRSARELISNEPRKDLSLRVISCGLIFQEVRWLPSLRFSGVRLTAKRAPQGGMKQHRNLKRLSPVLSTHLRNKRYFLDDEKDNKKLFSCSRSASR